MPKEVYTYGFAKDQKWPEEICPVPLDELGPKIIKWPGGPIVVSFDKSAAFVRQVADQRPGGLRTAVLLPDGWTPPARHLAYFDKRIPDGDKDAILDFAGQEKQA